MSDQQLKSFLRRVLKGFSARNYRVTPRLWQPDFGWDHSGVPFAFSIALTTYSGLSARTSFIRCLVVLLKTPQ